jgi:hypothetical protein
VSHMEIGDVLTQQSSFAGVLESYRKAMGILEIFNSARKGLKLDPSLVLISPVPYEKHHSFALLHVAAPTPMVVEPLYLSATLNNKAVFY